MTTIHEVGMVISALNERAPLAMAEKWDNVGMLIGDPSDPVTGAVVAIDFTAEVLQVALSKHYNLIINHHPCIFPSSKGLSSVVKNQDSTIDSLIYQAIRNGISVAAYHTNFDVCSLEVPDSICEALGIQSHGRFQQKNEADLTKLVGSADLARWNSKKVGYGFWGEFPETKDFSEFAKNVKRVFNINGFWITNPIPSRVKRVGFVAGKGSSFIEEATELKCDVFITGEAGYHPALSGLRKGTAVMELGHRESEKFFIETMKIWLSGLGIPCVEVQSPTQQIWT